MSQTNAKKLVSEMISAEFGDLAPDARQIIRDTRMNLQMAIKQDADRVGVERAISRVIHPTSNQGQMQLASLEDRWHSLPSASRLNEAIEESRRVLRMWRDE